MTGYQKLKRENEILWKHLQSWIRDYYRGIGESQALEQKVMFEIWAIKGEIEDAKEED